MKVADLNKLGIYGKAAILAAHKLAKALSRKGLRKSELRARIREIAAHPGLHVSDPLGGGLASAMLARTADLGRFDGRVAPAPFEQWGKDLDERSVDQMRNACRLPISVKGALMPDAHLGYGLPIGGVLATRNAVIPYAVGVDIACRMKMTVLDLPVSALDTREDRLERAIEEETRFGIGSAFHDRPRDHAVLDEDWTFDKVTKSFRDKAWKQLGSSGGGNHFVEFGELTLEQAELGLEPGTYLALLSHSGSRGTGAAVANHYSKLAQRIRSDLPKELLHLSWFDLDSHEGRAYWAAMQLMGRYAAANHDVIHRAVAKNLGGRVIADVENHHNFAWK
ncbi:MAG: RtcB family protein, partial [Planctomycetota bacterium]